MAHATFGEISEPSSRALFECDDVLGADNYLELRWRTIQSAENLKIQTLYVIEGKAMAEFMIKYVPALKHINTIDGVKCDLYNIDETTYVLMVKHFDVLASGEIVSLLQDYISTADNVILLQLKSKSEYLGTDDHSTAIVRGLYYKMDEQHAPKLKQPNIISGVCAAALHLRSHIDKPAALYVCYLEGSDYMDSKEVFDLLKKLNIKGCLKDTSFNYIPKTNMYI